MSLMSAIDALLAFVDEFEKALGLWHRTPGNVLAWNKPVPSTYRRFDLDEFEAVSRTVFLKAAEIGLDGRLPSKDTSAFDLNAESPVFVGQTNLPGTWFLDVGFLPRPTRHWRDAMLTLRALAEQAEAAGKKAEAAKGETPATPTLEILNGGLKYDKASVDLSGKPLACIRELVDAYQNRLDWKELSNRVWGQDAYTEKGTVKNAIKDARHALRKLAREAGMKVDGDYDPLPCVDQGKNLAWKLNFSA